MQKNQQQEERLVRAAQASDAEAFNRLVARHQDMAVAYAFSGLGDIHLAQDAAQEAFIEAYLRLKTLRNPGAFRYWLGLLVRKHCDRIRRGHPTNQVADLSELEELTGAADPAELYQATQERCQIRQAVMGLLDTHRQVLLLFYMGSLSHDEVGELLGIPAKTVKSRLHIARRRLKEKMMLMREETFVPLRPSQSDAFQKRVRQMIEAVERGDGSAITGLINEDPALANAKTKRRWWSGNIRALHVAVLEGKEEAVQALLEGGADPNAASDRVGWRPLHLAIRKPDIAALLIAAGAEVDIFATCGMGDEPRARALLTHEPDLATALGPDGAIPLHFAASPAIADLLIGLGAPIDAKDSSHEGSALAWALHDGRLDMARHLVARGATVDFWCACALDLVDQINAALASNPSLAQAVTHEKNILRPGFVAYPLHVAARYGAANAIQALIEAGADINMRSSDGSLAIHDAAFCGHLNTVRALLALGAPINDREHTYHATPLGCAKYSGHSRVAAYLKEQGGVE